MHALMISLRPTGYSSWLLPIASHNEGAQLGGAQNEHLAHLGLPCPQARSYRSPDAALTPRSRSGLWASAGEAPAATFTGY